MRLIKYSKRGNNGMAVVIGIERYYFSYETVIAFTCGGNIIVHPNEWGNTTGRHINDAIEHSGLCPVYTETPEEFIEEYCKSWDQNDKM